MGKCHAGTISISKTVTQATHIKKQFEEKKDSYFESNYSGNKNPGRTQRMALLDACFDRLNIRGKKVLDAGAGPAVLYEMIYAKGGQYVASDLSEHNIEAAIRRVGELEAVVADTCKLPFESSSFDIVCSIGSLEYIPDMEAALLELIRVLKPGGQLVVTFANAGSPARITDEYLVAPLRRFWNLLRKRPRYRRYLYAAPGINYFLRTHGIVAEEPLFFLPGIVGYPFRKIGFLKSWQERQSQKSSLARKMSMEFLVVGKKEER